MVEAPPRKLAVILHADVVGSTSLVHQNESLAHARIQGAFERLSSTIQSYNGMTHELRGDALVAEFARASDAVGAALAFQVGNTEQNARLGDDIKPQLRVGISLGEVVVADRTVTGAGVVLAQRVEQVAEPDGVCITGAINEAVPQHMPVHYSDLGKQEVKGFDEPVQIYGVQLAAGADPPSPEPGISIVAKTRGTKLWTASAALLVVIVGALGWFLYSQPDVESASVEKMAFPLPEEPSIAVLPFDNLSGDEGQDFLADGLTEDIITALARNPSLFVIARNSSFVYKDKAVSVKQVAEELGVRHVLEGSIQRDGGRIRITAQLLDAVTARHIWADSYDREFKDLLSLQDEISERLFVELGAEIVQGEDLRELHARVSSPEAFRYLMKARSIYHKHSKENNAIGLQLIRKAAEIEPNNLEIWLFEGYAHYRNYRNWWSEDREASLKKAIELGEKAYAVEPDYSATNGFMGVLSMTRRDYDAAVAYTRKSVELNPNSAVDRATFAWILTYSGYPEEAITQMQKAMRLSPHYPVWFTGVLGLAYLMTEDYENAIVAHEQLIERDALLPFAYSRLAGIHATLGNEAKANEYATELLKLKPKFSVQSWAKRLIYKNTEDLERELNMLRKAGLPEGGDA
jgi:TolB-like protein/class 3 adenylate cyclase/Flp pilus assembly protein TadD